MLVLLVEALLQISNIQKVMSLNKWIDLRSVICLGSNVAVKMINSLIKALNSINPKFAFGSWIVFVILFCFYLIFLAGLGFWRLCKSHGSIAAIFGWPLFGLILILFRWQGVALNHSCVFVSDVILNVFVPFQLNNVLNTRWSRKWWKNMISGLSSIHWFDWSVLVKFIWLISEMEIWILVYFL
jgi:hypothetical protein